ncbi:hypothetical protein ARAM_005243 [Aspergillus rambellii]|uniref:Uncharacterized protein n=1 Tax=Aspergillus rambellii TaxID=308745 RepID=A0A0F8UPY4_9EURO|nr:hypothetical protein ARAM_005243 [Aspergillus rambellii]
MEPKTNSIDAYPAHWKATLLGEEFWKDAEDFNQAVNDQIEEAHDQLLHTRFPFNIGTEQASRAPSSPASTVNPEKMPEKRSRRFSMSDASNLSSFTERNPLQMAPNRILEMTKSPFPFPFPRSRSRSRSRTRSSSIISETPRRSSSLLRSTLNMISGKKKEDPELEAATTTSILIMPLSPDQATLQNPLVEFRGGPTWASIPKDRRTLCLDVFWPDKKEKQEAEKEISMLPVEELAPLSAFRSLRVLKITGMTQTYQRYIWQAAWLNVDLDELELGMALPPRLRRSYVGKWPYMKGGWQLDKAHYGEPVYYGTGSGTLDRKVGIGEYLDKMCMEKAKICALAVGRTRQRLSIRTLTLTGFVVDADPFLHWFDPKRLKCIDFKDNCVDAGFYLCLPMKKVKILFPKQIREAVSTARVVDLFSELKVVELKGGKKVAESPFRGWEGLRGEGSSSIGGSVRGRYEKKKEEEEEEKEKEKEKEIEGGKHNAV